MMANNDDFELIPQERLDASLTGTSFLELPVKRDKFDVREVVSEAPPVSAPPKNDEQLPPFKATQSFAASIGAFPGKMFDDGKQDDRSHTDKAVDEYTQQKATNPVDGVAKGLVAFGYGFARGIKGVLTEPIKGAREEGGTGFFKGLGKGISGLFLKPLSGAVLFGSKTLEGIVSTPDTIIDKIREGDKRHFGISLLESLQKAVASQQRHITTKILQYLLENAIETEGLFRVAGNKTTLDQLHKDIDNGKDVAFETWTDVHGRGCLPQDAASLLKLYLNSLPEPLFPFDTHTALVKLAEKFDDPNNLEEECLSEFASILRSLPKGNRVRPLSFIMLYIDISSSNMEIAKHADKNKMTAENLSIVLGPTLIRRRIAHETSLQGNMKALSEVRATNFLVQMLIANVETLFEALDRTETDV